MFMGSIRKEIFSVRRQVLHSKVRCSKPRSPREIGANPILCLQVGHIGRSAMERELRIPPPSAPTEKRAAREDVPAAHRAQNRLKTETATQPRCLEAIPCSGRTGESKNLFQKTEHKSCCKHDTFGPRQGGWQKTSGFDLDCGVKSRRRIIGEGSMKRPQPGEA